MTQQPVDITSLASHYFQVVEQKGHGGSLMNLLLEDIAGNFSESNPGSLACWGATWRLSSSLARGRQDARA